MQRALARQAAIEKQLSKYLHLSCGHFQSYDTFEVYRFAAKSGETYCENCERTVKIAYPRKAKPLPETPLFLWHRRLGRDALHNAAQRELCGKTAHCAASNKPEL